MSVVTLPEIHPLADLVPSMTLGEYAELRDDIARNGLLDPIVLYEGKVLDGRHRLRACGDTATEPQFKDYEGDEPASFVLSHNLHRRNLTESQKAMLAVEFLPALEAEGRAKKAQAGASAAPSRPAEETSGQVATSFLSREEAGEKTGASGRAVGRAKRVKDADPVLAQKVLQGEVKVATAEREVAAREKAMQNGSKPPKPEKGKRMPGAIERIAEQLDATLLTLNDLALRKSCDGLNPTQREKAALTFKAAAKQFNALAKLLADSERTTA